LNLSGPLTIFAVVSCHWQELQDHNREKGVCGMGKAFLMTPGDGRPTANAYWMEDHKFVIPKVEHAIRGNGMEPVWLHDNTTAIASWAQAKQAGLKLLAEAEKGDVLVMLFTGWAWPEHAGVLFPMIQERVRSGDLKVILVCNMKEKAPGYVGACAAALKLEIMQLPYELLAVVNPSEVGWAKLKTALGQVMSGTYKRPRFVDPGVEVTDAHRKIARDAIRLIRESGCVGLSINASSMTMAQGWPHYSLCSRLGVTPIFIGSHEFEEAMAAIPQSRVHETYDLLLSTGIRIEYQDGGLCEEEIWEALRMYLVKLDYHKQGALCMGTQGQMEQIRRVATDLSESLMMSTISPFKVRPVIDVTEADWEALFTSVLMQYIVYVKTGIWKPIGFHDIRHYCLAEDTLVLLNSGALALDFMTDTPGGYSDIRLVSQNREVYFLNGGAAVMGNMRACRDATLARFHGFGMGYKLVVSRMHILPLAWEQRASVYGLLDKWPMGIVQIPGQVQEPHDPSLTPTLLATLAHRPNHGQHSADYIVPELIAASEELELPYAVMAG